MNEIEVSGRVLAGAFGLSERTVRELAERGIIKRVGRARFELLAATKAYTAHLREVSAGRGGEAAILDLTQERARLAREQADGQELKNRLTRGEIVAAEDVQREWSGMLRSVSAGLLAVPSRVRAAAGLSAEQTVTLDAEIRLALTELGHDNAYPPGGAEGAHPAGKSSAIEVD